METFTIDLSEFMSEEELEAFEKEQELFCDCGYLDEHPNENPIYVEKGHEVEGVGVCQKHGWICPNCNKFVQIG